MNVTAPLNTPVGISLTADHLQKKTHYTRIPSNTSYIAALSDDRTYSDGNGRSYDGRR